jgi:hypothetical protein
MPPRQIFGSTFPVGKGNKKAMEDADPFRLPDPIHEPGANRSLADTRSG